MALSLSTVGERISYARSLVGLTRYGLSIKAKVAPALVGQIERNPKADPYSSTIRTLARTLGVEPGWLLTGEGPTPTARGMAARLRRTGTEG